MYLAFLLTATDAALGRQPVKSYQKWHYESSSVFSWNQGLKAANAVVAAESMKHWLAESEEKALKRIDFNPTDWFF